MAPFQHLLAFLLVFLTAGETMMIQPVNTTDHSSTSTYIVRLPVTSDTMPTAPMPVDTPWPPTKTQAGQPTSCNRWYLVKPGDSCQIISQRSGGSISMDRLLAWNPELKKNCDHPLVDYWVCVGSMGGSGITLVYPAGSSNVSIPPYVPWTPRPSQTISFETGIPSPTQAGLDPKCSGFYQAITNDTCNRILSEHGLLSEKLFHEWNPALKSDCSGLIPEYHYCIAAYDNDDLPLPDHVTTKPSPTPEGIAKNCTAWYQVDKGDNCSLVVTMFGTFSQEQFISWNPILGKECFGLRKGYFYCVGDSSTPTTRTAKLPTPTDFATVTPSRHRNPSDSGWMPVRSTTYTLRTVTHTTPITTHC
ncbi:uncharacterized protein BO97DRAFT_422109 [Aspergillus homomorphus CBS 101889]|uniref:LysM domain-containing protein n=1 Tax=Aspergillus homomorphus (strain CBS 101889) TaxID=1450537 RepID=A0A395I456_ASPHC|nr:hypothetical protein BO97DRAFT_422109 [Aspergillus homomorphus CBS 101889]RAL14757.1 hypothetical protein BO97DRAFT_422109 [Aspergillus homomorphus CBS 101889]